MANLLTASSSADTQNSTIAPTLVFIHGWGSDASVWNALCAQLPGIHIPIDLPGFGKNKSLSKIHLNAYLKKLVADLPDNCILLGWSLGGMLAARLANLAPNKVKGLVTFATNAAFVADDAWPYAMASATFTAFLEQFNDAPQKTFSRFCVLQTKGDAQAKSLLSELKSHSPAAAQVEMWFATLAWLKELDNRQTLKEIQQPQLHVLAECDALVPVQVLELYQKQLGLVCKVVPGASHCLLYTHAQECARLVKTFLQPWFGISKQKIARSFSAAAVTYDSAAKVQQSAGSALLNFIQTPLVGTWLDVGSGTGFLFRNLKTEFKPNHWVSGDIAFGMLSNAKKSTSTQNTAWVGLDVEQLPFAANSLDGVISSLALQWVCDLSVALRQCFAAIKPGGECIVATLASETLHELKTAWQAVDEFTHVNRFLSTNQIKNAFEQAGFELLHCQDKMFIDEYTDLMPLLKSLKTIGAHNMNAGQKPGLTTRRHLQIVSEAYEPFRNHKGKLPVTYQVLFVRAKKHE